MSRVLVILCAVALGGSPAGQPAAAAAASDAAAGGEKGCDVRKWGAVGDGVADDGAALQAALAAGGDVCLPTGVYAVTSPLRVKGRLRIRGEPGATLVTRAPSGALLRASGALTGFELRDVVLRSDRKDLEKRGEALFAVDGHDVAGAILERLELDTGASFQNAISLATTRATTIRDVDIRDCLFRGASAGVEIVQHRDEVQRVTDVRIRNNRFRHNGLKDDQYAGFAISLSGPHARIEVVGNDIEGYPYAGVEVVAPKSGGFVADDRIEDNTVVRTGRGIITDTAAGGPASRLSNVSISRNVIRDCRFFQRFSGLRDSVVRDNVVVIRHAAASRDHQYDFIAFLDDDHLLVAGNVLSVELPPEEAAKAIVAVASVRDSHFTGNVLTASGVHVLRVGRPERPATDNSFTANRFEHRSNGDVRDPVWFDGDATVRNVLTGSTILKRHDRTARSQSPDNRLEGNQEIRLGPAPGGAAP